MKRDNVDSAGNALADIQAIESDIDPNTPANVSLSNPPGPNGGCGGGQKASSTGQLRNGAVGALFCLSSDSGFALFSHELHSVSGTALLEFLSTAARTGFVAANLG